ncbi:MAG: HEAT repeat domain-containing protein [Planctomycetota bacterium]
MSTKAWSALATILLALGALKLLLPSGQPAPAPPTAEVAAPSPDGPAEDDELQRLRAEVARLRAERTARDAAPCPRCAARAPDVAQPAAPPPAPPAPPASPGSLAGWIEELRGRQGPPPDALLAWARADRRRLLEVVAALPEVSDPRALAALRELLQREGARDPEVQRALLALATGRGPDPARAAALGALAHALRADPLADDRLGDPERADLERLARGGPPEVRAAAVEVLAEVPRDRRAVAVFRELWSDPSLPEDARNKAVLALRFAPADQALATLLEVIRGGAGVPVPLRQQAAVSLAYLNPRERPAELFDELLPTFEREQDWLVKGFGMLALMQVDHARAAAELQRLAQAQQDPWERERYLALAEIAAREQDYQRIVHQGVAVFRELEARKQAGLAPR